MNINLRFILSCIVFLALIFGCSVSTKVVMKTDKQRAPLSPEDVSVYVDHDQVKGKYEELALIISKGNFQHTDEEEMLDDMRKKASEIGANGLILKEIAEPAIYKQIMSQHLPYTAQRRGEATAIFVYPYIDIKAD